MTEQSPNTQPVVMIVDDEPMVLEVSSLMVESLGFEAESYSSPSEALVAFQQNPERYALVLMDMVMPAYSGKELFIKLKDLRPDIKAIISSGYQMNESNNDLLDLGVSGFINKPFTMDILKHTLNEVLDTTN